MGLYFWDDRDGHIDRLEGNEAREIQIKLGFEERFELGCKDIGSLFVF